MATLNPVTCTTDWTLVYDSAVSGAYSGTIQTSGLSVMRVASALPTEMSGILNSGAGGLINTIVLSGTDKLYIRASSGTVVAILG